MAAADARRRRTNSSSRARQSALTPGGTRGISMARGTDGAAGGGVGVAVGVGEADTAVVAGVPGTSGVNTPGAGTVAVVRDVVVSGVKEYVSGAFAGTGTTVTTDDADENGTKGTLEARDTVPVGVGVAVGTLTQSGSMSLVWMASCFALGGAESRGG